MRTSSLFSADRGMREAVAPIKADATATFVHDIADVDFDDARSFGGKATGLAKMARIGIPIPPAFVVGTNGFHH
ncbi:MAG: pyruvate, orthophosphate dikinase, partial [Acidobacteriaceae bacterium]